MYNDFNMVQLSKAIGKSRVTIYAWLSLGMPRNEDKSFDLPAVVAWMEARAGNEALAKSCRHAEI